MTTVKLLVAFCLLFSCSVFCQKNNNYNSFLNKLYKQSLHEQLTNKKGKRSYLLAEAIPDSITAVKVAEVILTRVYGEKNIQEEKPFTAILSEGYWIVYGYLPKEKDGGAAEIFMNKRTGEVIRLSHSK